MQNLKFKWLQLDWPHNHLVCKWTLNHLAQLAKWLSKVVDQTKWLWFQSSCDHLNFRLCACFEQGVPWHSGNYRVWISSETIRNMTRRYSQMQHTDKWSQHSSITKPIWLNGWVLIYELSGCGFELSCSHLNFKFCTCFGQGVPWYLGNYRVWILDDKNIHSNAPYR